MFPAAAATDDKPLVADEDAPTQVIDDDQMRASTAGGEKLIDCQHDSNSKVVAGSMHLNTDDACTQVFAASGNTDEYEVRDKARLIDGKDAATEVDFGDDLPTQAFDELSEKVDTVTSKKKDAKGRGQAKRADVRKNAEENLDNLATQVFDSFVPPALPSSRKSQPVQSAEVVDGRVENAEMEGPLTSGRQTRRRMSLKTSHGLGIDLAAANKADAATPVLDTVPASVDDLLTQAFEPNNISAVPSASGCLDDVATQVFDDAPALKSTTVPVAESCSGSELTLKSTTGAEDAETQVFDNVEPVVDKRTMRTSKAAETERKNSSAIAGRRTTKKSTGKKMMNASTIDDVAADEMDDLATQVFDAETCEKPSKSSKNLEPKEADGSGANARKLGKIRSKPGSGSYAMAELDKEKKVEQDRDVQSSARDKVLESQRLSSRAGKSQHRTKEPSLSEVPENADAGQPRTARSQRKGSKQTNPLVSDDGSDMRAQSSEVADIGELKASSSAGCKETDAVKPKAVKLQGKRGKSVNLLEPNDSAKPQVIVETEVPSDSESEAPSSTASKETNAVKPKAARLQGKRAKSVNLSGSHDFTDSPISVEALYRKVPAEGSAKVLDRRRQQRSKKESTAELGMAGASEMKYDGMDSAEVLAESPATATETLASKTPGKLSSKKKLYTAKGPSVYLFCIHFLERLFALW